MKPIIPLIIILLAMIFLVSITIQIKESNTKQTTVTVYEFGQLVDPELGICIYKCRNLYNEEVKVEATCCKYGIGSIIPRSDKYFKIR